jgi:cardiolipin synthase
MLSMLRILLAPVFFGLVAYRSMVWAFWIFFIGGMTDSLDGLLARMLNQKSDLGKTLDPVADKVFLSSAALCLGWYGFIPRWVVILFVTRDLLLVSGVILLKLLDSPIPIDPHLLGKITTTLQVFYLGLVMMKNAGFPLLPELLFPLQVSAVMFSLISGGYYIIRGFAWAQKEKNGYHANDR